MRHFPLIATCIFFAIFTHFSFAYASEKPPQRLSQKKSQALIQELSGVLKRSDPRTALQSLSKKMKLDPAIAGSCHAIVHAIGRAGYQKYKDFAQALSFQEPVCISGYVHGVIEENFKQSKDIIESILSACSNYPEGSFERWNCYHGVGHGIMYFTGNDLFRSLDLCDTYETEFEQVNCADGVLMENFNSDMRFHPSRFVQPTDPTYPCAKISQKFHDACYLYAAKYYLSLVKNNYQKALNWCRILDAKAQPRCFAGIGGDAIKHFISTPLRAEKICMQASKEGRAPCLDGMIGLYIHHNGSLLPAQKLCKKLQKENRVTCEHAIQKRMYLFPKT